MIGHPQVAKLVHLFLDLAPGIVGEGDGVVVRVDGVNQPILVIIMILNIGHPFVLIPIQAQQQVTAVVIVKFLLLIFRRIDQRAGTGFGCQDIAVGAVEIAGRDTQLIIEQLLRLIGCIAFDIAWILDFPEPAKFVVDKGGLSLQCIGFALGSPE